jgi:carboxypeptidase C (cathepsin A)
MEIADNVYQFLQGFLEQNPKFRAAPFFLTGESYAGHYLPSVGYRVLEGNRDPREPKINLQAIAIGNGLVNPKVQYAEYLPFITVQDKLPQSSLDWMAAGLPLCMDAISKCNPDNTTSLTDCLMATATCNLFELIPFQFSGLNVYDVREVSRTRART